MKSIRENLDQIRYSVDLNIDPGFISIPLKFIDSFFSPLELELTTKMYSFFVQENEII